MPSGYVYMWEYQVSPGSEVEFEALYCPEGAWGSLFRRYPGYLRTELLKDRENPMRYLTVDYWESKGAHAAFRARSKAEFEALDRAGERLTLKENFLGEFLWLE